MNVPRTLTDIPAFRADRFGAAGPIAHWSGTTVAESVNADDFLRTVEAYRKWFHKMPDSCTGATVCTFMNTGSASLLAAEFALMQLGAAIAPVSIGLPDDHLNSTLDLLKPAFCLAQSDKTRSRYPNINSSISWVFLDQISTEIESNQTEPALSDGNNNRPDDTLPVDPEQRALIICTSGTTGQPKGVELSHAAIIANVLAVMAVIPITQRSTVLSMLPLSHVMERMAVYAYLIIGASLHFAESPRHAMVLFKKVNPHYFTAVPRVLEKIFRAFHKAGEEKHFFSRQIFHWALMRSRKPGAVNFLARLVALRKLKNIFGRRIKGIVVGGAALNADLATWYETAGVPVRTGYGLTETCGAVTMNRFIPGEHKRNTVGLTLPGVEVQIRRPDENVETGLIHVKGPSLMTGYTGSKSDNGITDGWLNTGDTGKLIDGKFLQITGRTKTIFKNSYGVYVAPGKIESQLEQDYWIDISMVVGFQRSFTGALILPDFDEVQSWCSANQVHWTAPQYMVHNPEVISAFQTRVDEINKTLSEHEKIRGYKLIAEDWSIENHLLTDTLKLRRGKITEKYAKAIDEIYRK